MNDIEISDLYQEMIVDHSRRPRNFRRIEHATHQADGFNPLCGDKVKVYVHLENDVLRDLSFEGEGCAISKASASLMTETLKGKSKSEAARDYFCKVRLGDVPIATFWDWRSLRNMLASARRGLHADPLPMAN